MPDNGALEESEIARRLVELPSWRHADGAIQRRFRTQNFKSTLMLVTAVGHLCEVAWHHPEMVVGYNTLVVKLWTHSAGGVTTKDFALAAKIEDVIGWQPAREAGGLTGPPDDPRHAYLLPDKERDRGPP